MAVDDFRLVIISDDPDDAAQLRQCLLRGFEREVTLVEARTGNEGLAACLGHGAPRPDCVIVDLHLPDMSGLEVLERLKDDAGDPLFPVVLFVDSGDDCKAAAAALKAGAQDYIGKSWLTADGLACAVENAIVRHDMLVRLRMKRAALDRRDREFKALVENAPDIITRFDTRFRHLYINPAIERATGLLPEHYIGKSSRDAGMPGALCDFWEAKLREAIEGRREIGFEFEFESPGGRRAYQARLVPELSVTGEVESVLGVSTEITDRKRAEETARTSAARERVCAAEFETVVRAAPAAIWIAHDPGCLQITGNPASYKLLRMVENSNASPLALEIDQASRPFQEYRDGQPVPPHELPLQVAIAEDVEIQGTELTLKFHDGVERHIYGNASPLREPDGTVYGAIAVFIDITERKRAEKALKDADRRKDDFLGMLAHELRNPLAAIRSSVHLIRLKAPDEPGLNWCREVIERQVKQLTRLIDDLLDVSRIRTGKIQLQRQRLDVNQVLTRAAEAVRPLVEAKQHQLSVVLAPGPLSAMADAARLEQVISNLLANAIKYTDKGGVLTLSGALEEPWVVIRVRDNGIGLAPEQISGVFDLFAQINGAVDRSQGGLGIGLPLVRTLVEMHGGNVSASSEGAGKGSEFTVKIPGLAKHPEREGGASQAPKADRDS